MRVFLLTFCDLMIDRLNEHGAHRGRKRPLSVPTDFFNSYESILKSAGAIPSLANGSNTVLKFELSRIGFGGEVRNFEKTPEELKQCFCFFRSLLEVLYDFDEKLSSQPFDLNFSTGLKEIISWEIDDFVSHAKYVTACPIAKYLRNELPKRPTNFVGHFLLFPGAVRRYLRNRINSHSVKNMRLFFGYLQGVKRGAAVVPDTFVQMSEEKHQFAMMAIPRNSWPERVDFQEYLPRFFRNLGEAKFDFFEASASASFEQKRSDGGAKGFIVNKYFDNLSPSGTLSSNDRDLYQMEESRPGLVETRHVNVVPINEGDILRELEKLPEQLTVRVSAVLEPLKVRLITKGMAWPYYFSRFYQKYLWRYLSRFPQFRLISRPLIEEDLYDLIERETKIDLDFGDDVFFVSGDYSSATDNLNINYTKAVFESSLFYSGLKNASQRDVLRKVIYEQYLTYSSSRDDDGGYILHPQNNGQLMGSTLSFPILCTVNLICYWMALEEYLERRVNLKDLPVLVNGDDIGFRANKQLYLIWKHKIMNAGFELSLGKNYTHKKFFTINSEMFYYSNKTFQKIPFFNIGLLQNLQVDQRERAIKPIWDNYNGSVGSACNRVFAHRRFFHYNYDQIQSVTMGGNYNLFVSSFLGGLGFTLFDELRDQLMITSFQRKLASFVLNKLRSGLQTSESPRQFFKALLKTVNEDLTASSFKPIEKFHYGTYVLVDSYGPLTEFQKDTFVSEFSSPILASESIVDKTLTLSFPGASLLRDFRKADLSRKSQLYRDSRILTRKYRLVEVKKFVIDESLKSAVSTGPIDMSIYSEDISGL